MGIAYPYEISAKEPCCLFYHPRIRRWCVLYRAVFLDEAFCLIGHVCPRIESLIATHVSERKTVLDTPGGISQSKVELSEPVFVLVFDLLIELSSVAQKFFIPVPALEHLVPLIEARFRNRKWEIGTAIAVFHR